MKSIKFLYALLKNQKYITVQHFQIEYKSVYKRADKRRPGIYICIINFDFK